MVVEDEAEPTLAEAMAQLEGLSPEQFCRVMKSSREDLLALAIGTLARNHAGLSRRLATIFRRACADPTHGDLAASAWAAAEAAAATFETIQAQFEARLAGPVS